MGRFKDLLGERPYLLLHGALGTELEFRGHDVSGKLWSARYLIEQPELIQDIHEDYLRAGADIVTTSSYQASIPGFLDYGLSEEEARQMIATTVHLANQARERVWSDLLPKERARRIYPLISGDVGPYAAYLADGSEYTGDYGVIDKEHLKNFHRSRIKLLLEAGVDLLALETMPNLLEVEALVELLAEEFPQTEAYLSLTSQDGQHLTDGSAIEEVARLAETSPQILAIGINCSSPLLFNTLLEKIRKVSSKPLVTYPNSGEIYDGKTQTWHKGNASDFSLLENTQTWLALGAKVVGGCCRTRPADIACLKAGLEA